jgi:hypothetical protein
MMTKTLALSFALFDLALWVVGFCLLNPPTEAEAFALDSIITAGRHSGAAMAGASLYLGVMLALNLIKHRRG